MLQDFFVYTLGPFPAAAVLIAVTVATLIWIVGCVIGFTERYNKNREWAAERAEREYRHRIEQERNRK